MTMTWHRYKINLEPNNVQIGIVSVKNYSVRALEHIIFGVIGLTKNEESYFTFYFILPSRLSIVGKKNKMKQKTQKQTLMLR